MPETAFWTKLWNEKGELSTDFHATGRGGMDVVGFLHTVCEAARLLNLEKRHDLLDIGCGTGIFALAFSPWVRSIHGIDIAESLVKRANRNLSDVANVRFSVNSIDDIPAKNDSFDRVLAYSVLQYLPGESGVRDGLAEVARVLRPGGRGLLAANPAPARRSALIAAIEKKPDPEMRRIEKNLLDKTVWISPARLGELANEVGLSAEISPISKHIWQHFYMYDSVVTKHE